VALRSDAAVFWRTKGPLSAASSGSGPVGSIQRTIPDGLADVLGEQFVRAFEVGDGATDFKYPVVGARGEALPRHGLLQQLLARGVEAAVAADEARGHLRVGEDAASTEAFVLARARRQHPRADVRGALALGRAPVRKLLEAHGGYIDVDVDAVEQRPRDASDVALNLRGRAAAFAHGVVPEAAGARVHRGGEHEGGREGQRHRGAADGDTPVFQRLAQNFQHRAVELGQLVEEEHAVVCE
jgi:hypothetical protein